MIPAPNAQNQSKRVLLAEDNKITQEILQLTLKRKGHEVVTVENAESALKALTQEEFDIVFVDFHLPDATGAELISKFFQYNISAYTPRIIALTGDPQMVIEAEKERKHFDLILAKPFMIADLVDIVSSKESVSHRIDLRSDIVKSNNNAAEPILSSNHDYHIIYFPHDFYSSVSNAVSMSIARNGPVDLLVFDHLPRPAEAELLSQIKGLGMAMHVDRTGEYGYETDFSATENYSQAELSNHIKNRNLMKGKIRSELHYCKNIATNLMISSFLKGSAFIPQRNVWRKKGISYNHILPAEKIIEILKPLCASKHFSRQESHIFKLCPKCKSSRICPALNNEFATSELQCMDCDATFSNQFVLETQFESFKIAQKAIDQISCPQTSEPSNNTKEWRSLD